jgi:acetoin utilization protein AcuB
MREKSFRRLPVVDDKGALVGIVTEKDLLAALPSPATTLAVWEIPEILSKLKIEKVMTAHVVTVSEDVPVEDAARIMTDREIGALPVMKGNTLAGIITESDIFKVLLEMMGGRRPGARVTVSIPDEKGAFARVTGAVTSAGGDIVGLGVGEIKGTGGAQWVVTMKAQDILLDSLVKALRPVVSEILDARVM